MQSIWSGPRLASYARDAGSIPASATKVFTVYQITNLVNGKTYIGKHETFNINDGYFGSGRALRQAIQKYGKENFCKVVLYSFSTRREMNLAERILVVVDRDTTYNLGPGGEGGPLFKGKTHNEKTRKRLSQLGSGRKLSRETIEKRTRTRSQKNINYTDEGRKKLSDAARRSWLNRIPAQQSVKLSPEDALAIFNSTEPNKTIARQYGIDPAMVRGIKRKKYWKNIHDS